MNVFDWLYFIQSLSSFSSIDHLVLLCARFFDAISSGRDEVLSFNSSANVLVLTHFNVPHKDWLTYSGRTDRPGELYYNFSISNDLTQMVYFPTGILDGYWHSCSSGFIYLF